MVIDYKRMYKLMHKAAIDSLNILSFELDDDSINGVRFLLEQALIMSEHVYDVTASGKYEAKEQSVL
jgi:hypothetical protein